MTKDELLILKGILEEVKIHQENSGCNDYFMDKNPDNMSLMKKLNDFYKNDSSGKPFEVIDEKIVGTDLHVTIYAISILDKELKYEYTSS